MDSSFYKSVLLDLVMMVLCPKAGSLAFTPPGDEMSEMFPVAFLEQGFWLYARITKMCLIDILCVCVWV